MAAGKSGGKEPANIVHQQAILVETIHKEERHQKLFTTYSINPFRKSKLSLCSNSVERLRFVGSANRRHSIVMMLIVV
jgi:hypothetical protein